MLVAINFFNAGQFVQPSILVIDSALQHTAQFMPEPDKLRLWLTPSAKRIRLDKLTSVGNGQPNVHSFSSKLFQT